MLVVILIFIVFFFERAAVSKKRKREIGSENLSENLKGIMDFWLKIAVLVTLFMIGLSQLFRLGWI